METSGTFGAGTDGIGFWESMEGMLLQIADPAAVGARNTHGEIPIIPNGSGVRTNRGGNIRCMFLYRTDRGLSFVDRPGGTATADTPRWSN